MKYKKKSKYLISIFIFFILIQNFYCYYILPLNESYEYDNKDTNNISKIMLNDIKNNIYTIIEIGELGQKLALFIKTKDYCSYIGSNLCHISESNYDYKKSKSFENITPYNLTYKNFMNISLAKEKIKLLTNKDNYSESKEINLTKFYHILNDEESAGNINTCGVFGFQYKINNDIEGENNCKSFINNLYDNVNILSLIDNSDELEPPIFSIEYSKENNNDIKNRLIIGIYPNDYNPNSYKENSYREIYMNNTSISSFDKYHFHLIFNDIYLLNKNESKTILKNSTYLHSIFIIEQNMISAPESFFELYLENFFNAYIKNQSCEILLIDDYKTLFCNKKKLDINSFYNSFPSLVFNHSGFDTKFEFNKNELFKEDENNIYFMIFSDKSNNDVWGLGKIFMEKYLFVFNYKNGTIRYYNKTEDNINKFNFIENGIYVIIIFGLNIIIAFICLFICLYKKCSKNKIDPTILIESFSANIDYDKDDNVNIINKGEEKKDDDLIENNEDIEEKIE